MSDDLIFVLRKAAGFAVSPYIWLLVLLGLVLVLLLRGRMKAGVCVLLATIAALILIGSVPLGWPMIQQREAVHLPAPLEGPIDGIILLGGGERLKVSAHWGRAEISDGGDRVIAAAIASFPEMTELIIIGSLDSM